MPEVCLHPPAHILLLDRQMGEICGREPGIHSSTLWHGKGADAVQHGGGHSIEAAAGPG